MADAAGAVCRGACAPACIGPTVLLAAKTYANDALKRAITVAFCIFRTENPILRIIDPALTPILFLNVLSPATVG